MPASRTRRRPDGRGYAPVPRRPSVRRHRIRHGHRSGGQAVKATSPAGGTITQVYDKLGRLISYTDADGRGLRRRAVGRERC
ncbi:RHS repeat domain-containing protein [Streptomyces halstedii]|nr:RHS repeat domain-containing protein [Streptomyces sp. NTK 937]